MDMLPVRTLRALLVIVCATIVPCLGPTGCNKKEKEKGQEPADERKKGSVEERNSDHDLIQGMWTVEAKGDFKAGGMGVRWVFTAETVSFGQSPASYKLDPSKKPRAIELVFIDGANKGQKFDGIYALSGDTLKLCLSNHPDAGRPTEFVDKAGIDLYVMKRERR